MRAVDRRRRDQRGVTLVEVLVSIVVLGITVGGLALASVGTSRTSSAINNVERTDVLLSAFGESLKTLPYQVCAPANGATYQSAFEANEAALSSANRKLAQSTRTTMAITAVTRDASCDLNGKDSGTQTLTIATKVGDRKRTGTVVKRNPNALAEPVVVKFKGTEVSPRGNPQFAYQLTAEESFAPAGIFQYEWTCDVAAVPPVTFTTYSSVDGSVICEYTAPTGADPVANATTKTARLVITDNDGLTYQVEQPLTIFASAAPTAPVDAQIGASPAAPYTTSSQIMFTSIGVPPTETSIVRWAWNFDNTDFGADNVVVCDTATCVPQTRRFTKAGTYTVRLTLTDNRGTQSVATYVVTIPAPAIPNPVPTFTQSAASGVFASPLVGVYSQRVNFNGSGSTPPSGATITSYDWDYGDGSPIDHGATPNHIYTSAAVDPAGFVVKMTVYSSNGGSASTTTRVKLTPLIPPINFVPSDSKGETLFSRGWIKFSWKNVPRSAGDTISLEVRLSFPTFVCGNVVTSKTIEFAAGADGTVQSGTYNATFGLCPWSNYQYEVRTKRIPAYDTTPVYSPWTSPVSATIKGLF